MYTVILIRKNGDRTDLGKVAGGDNGFDLTGRASLLARTYLGHSIGYTSLSACGDAVPRPAILCYE